MANPSKGISILELLVVMAIIGILAGLGFVNLPRDRFAVNQAAEGLARDVQFARFQAISRNTFVVLEIDEAENAYRIVERDTGAVIKNVQLGGSSSTAQTAIELGENADKIQLIFDPRGIGRGSGAQHVVIESTATEHTRTVRLSGQGRATIE